MPPIHQTWDDADRDSDAVLTPQNGSTRANSMVRLAERLGDVASRLDSTSNGLSALSTGQAIGLACGVLVVVVLCILAYLKMRNRDYDGARALLCHALTLCGSLFRIAIPDPDLR